MEYKKDYFNKVNFISKFDKIIEARYRTGKANTPNKQMRAFYSTYKEKYPYDKFDIGTSVRQWRSFKSNQLPNVENLMKLCSVLECDIDYFLTEQEEFEKDVQQAADYLGLSYETVERIKNYDGKIKGLIDVITFDNHNNHSDSVLENADLLFELLDSFYSYAINYGTVEIKCKPSVSEEYTISDKKQIDSVLRNSSLRECGTILNTLCVEYKDTRDYNTWAYMNDLINNLVESGEDESQLRTKYHVPKQFDKSFPRHF